MFGVGPRRRPLGYARPLERGVYDLSTVQVFTEAVEYLYAGMDMSNTGRVNNVMCESCILNGNFVSRLAFYEHGAGISLVVYILGSFVLNAS